MATKYEQVAERMHQASVDCIHDGADMYQRKDIHAKLAAILRDEFGPMEEAIEVVDHHIKMLNGNEAYHYAVAHNNGFGVGLSVAQALERLFKRYSSTPGMSYGDMYRIQVILSGPHMKELMNDTTGSITERGE